MTIQEIDDKIKVLQTELSVSKDSTSQAAIQKKISVLKLKREIETIKFKIQQLETI